MSSIKDSAVSQQTTTMLIMQMKQLRLSANANNQSKK
jgi:hypothetical protein